MEPEIKEEPSFLEQVKIEREALEKVRDELRAETAKQQELRAVEILSGKTDAGQKPAEKKELTPQEYAAEVARGNIP